MAHSPETKAAVVAAIIAGEPWRDVSQRFGGVSTATIRRWIEEAKADGIAILPSEERPANIATIEDRRAEFQNKLTEFLVVVLDLGLSLGREAAKPDFIKSQPGESRQIAEFLFDRSERLFDILRQPDAESEDSESQTPSPADPGGGAGPGVGGVAAEALPAHSHGSDGEEASAGMELV